MLLVLLNKLYVNIVVRKGGLFGACSFHVVKRVDVKREERNADALRVDLNTWLAESCLKTATQMSTEMLWNNNHNVIIDKQ